MSDNDDPLLENIIMKFLYTNDVVRDKVIPYFRYSIFDIDENITLMKFIIKFMDRYSKFPNVKETKLKLKEFSVIAHLTTILEIDTSEYTDEIILSEIQTYIQQKAVMDVCFKVAENVTNDKMSEILNAPDEMREALAFSFDNNVGLDLFNEDAEDAIYEDIHSTEKFIPTGLESIDMLIDGGVHEKTLTLLMAETNLGKSLIMGAIGKNNLFNGKNVLYITCEMSEHKIAGRVIANALNLNPKDLKKLTKEKFSECFKKVRSTISGKFIVKEYPTLVCTANHIRNLVKELQLKRNFYPDIIYIDYIGIMSATYKTKSDNTYTSQKRITEEVRGLASELSVPIISAIQTNRSGMGKDGLDLTNVSDSIGTAFTADIMIGVTQSKEQKARGIYIMDIIKNRYGNKNISIPIKVNYNTLSLFDDAEFLETLKAKMGDDIDSYDLKTDNSIESSDSATNTKSPINRKKAVKVIRQREKIKSNIEY